VQDAKDESEKCFNFAQMKLPKAEALFLAVSTVWLSAGHSLSEHSMTFEFLEFKPTCLAGKLAQPNLKI